jgi:hypothetical protein
MSASPLKLVAALFALLPLTAPPSGRAQTTPAPQRETARPAPPCDRQRALGLVREAVAEAKSLEDPVARIAILNAAADLLWPHEQELARAHFRDSYELAVNAFGERGNWVLNEGGLKVEPPDQRFVVMRAIARRDPAWARALAEKIADDARRAAEQATATTGEGTSAGERKTTEVAERLLGLAQTLLTVDRPTALALARSSFRQPASYALIHFLYTLAETDGAAADGLFREALAAYADRAAVDLLYLAVYPFALNREPGPVPVGVYYTPPPGFAPDARLGELYLETLFRQVESRFKVPEAAREAEDYIASEQERLLTALTMLEPLVARRHPSLHGRALMLRGAATAATTERSRRQAEGFARNARDYEEAGLFERMVERIESETDPQQRDFAVARVVTSVKDAEQFERAEPLLDKVDDAALREKLTSLLYFRRTQQAIKDGLLDEAARFAGKVTELDYRALLSFEIAGAALKNLDDKGRAVELLDAVERDARKAPDTPEKARALLGVSHLYAKFDAPRAGEVLRSAVKTINLLPSPDFSSDRIGRQLGNKYFMMYGMHEVPGARLPNVFRELGARDFDGALDAARAIEHHPLRASAVLALTAECLERSEKQGAPGAKPKPAPKGSRKDSKQ